MNWKSYAVVSGATVFAGWLAAAPPSNAPAGARDAQAPARPASSPTSQTAGAPTDIELQAMRLQARLRAERVYSEPARDPFRFAPRRAPAAAVPEREPPIADVPPPAPVDLGPPAPMVSLAGIAEDLIDGRTARTAVLSAPAGVLIVREGDEILGYYRVARIESEAVELVPLGNGAPRRLTFK